MAAAMDLSAPTHAFSSPASSVDKMARRRQLVAEREQLEREQALRLAKTAGSSGSAGIPSLPASGPGAGDGAGVSGAGAGSALSSAHVPVHGQHVAQVDGSVVLSPRDPSRPRDPLPSQVTEAIYLSGKEPASDARWLSEHNVGGIINLCHADGVENAFERRHDQEGEAEADAEGSGVCGWRQDCGARPRQHRQGHTPEARTDRCAITGGGGSTVVATAAAGSGHHSAISHDVTASAGDTKSIDKGNGHGSTAMTASDRESDTDGRRSAEHSQIGQNGLAKGLQLQYLTLDVYDADSLGAHSDISQYFGATRAFINSVLASGRRVLVHCHSGESRGPAVVLAYLIADKHMPLADALALVRPNNGFMRALLHLEQRTRGQTSLEISNFPPPILMADPVDPVGRASPAPSPAPAPAPAPSATDSDSAPAARSE